MSKTDQALQIEPQHELKFVGSFKSPITSYIKLTNPTDKAIGFKIKTTAPKKYCVRPNSGTLEAKEFINIAVSLQALDFDQSEKNKHKFMVQSIFVPDGDFNLEHLWKDVKEELVMGTKLKCVFERKESNTDGTGRGSAVEASNAVLINSAPPPYEEKNKRIGDSPSIHHQDGELQKAAKEVKQLREDESSLRHENMMLKEEALRLQQLCKSEGHSQVPMHHAMGQPVQPVQPVMVIIAIVVCMVGIVLGKFIL